MGPACHLILHDKAVLVTDKAVSEFARRVLLFSFSLPDKQGSSESMFLELEFRFVIFRCSGS